MMHKLKNELLYLLELQGKFYISVSVRKRRPTVLPSFSIRLDKKDREIAYLIEKISKGELRENSKSLIFVVRKFEECQKIAKMLEKHDFLLPSKKEKFYKWIKILGIIEESRHLTEDGFLEICRIKDEISESKSYTKFKKMIDNGELNFTEKSVEMGKKISKGKKIMNLLKNNL